MRRRSAKGEDFEGQIRLVREVTRSRLAIFVTGIGGAVFMVAGAKGYITGDYSELRIAWDTFALPLGAVWAVYFRNGKSGGDDP